MFSDAHFQFLLTSVAVGLSALFPVITRLFIRRKQSLHDKRNDLKELVSKKIESGILLSVQDIIDIAKGIGLGQYSAIRVIYYLFAHASDQKHHEAMHKLIDDIQHIEPFQNMPDDIRPSLVILSKMCSSSSDESVKYALSPIQRTIEKYLDLLSEYEKVKALSQKAYMITIISFIVGAVGVILAFNTPNSKDIEHAVNQGIKSQIKAELLQPHK